MPDGESLKQLGLTNSAATIKVCRPNGFLGGVFLGALHQHQLYTSCLMGCMQHNAERAMLGALGILWQLCLHAVLCCAVACCGGVQACGSQLFPNGWFESPFSKAFSKVRQSDALQLIATTGSRHSWP